MADNYNFDAEKLRISRRKQLADLIGKSVSGDGQMVSGIYVPPGGKAGGLNILTQALSGYMQGKAAEEEKDRGFRRLPSCRHRHRVRPERRAPEAQARQRGG